MATRNICIEIPLPPPVPTMTVPGAGTVELVREFLLGATNTCQDARAFLQGLQPIMVGLGIPLCILGCTTAIIGVFTTDFPYIDPSALANVVSQCACLASFTPFGFCSMIVSIVSAINSLLDCIIALMGDITALESQAANLLSDPLTAAAGQCLGANAATMRDSIATSFGPVSELLNGSSTLFAFVGVPLSPIGGLTGGSTAAVIASITPIQTALDALLVTIGSICP